MLLEENIKSCVSFFYIGMFQWCTQTCSLMHHWIINENMEYLTSIKKEKKIIENMDKISDFLVGNFIHPDVHVLIQIKRWLCNKILHLRYISKSKWLIKSVSALNGHKLAPRGLFLNNMTHIMTFEHLTNSPYSAVAQFWRNITMIC